MIRIASALVEMAREQFRAAFETASASIAAPTNIGSQTAIESETQPTLAYPAMNQVAVPTPLTTHSTNLALWHKALTERSAVWNQHWPRHAIFSMIILPTMSIAKNPDHASMKKLLRQAHVNGAGLTLPNCSEDQTMSIQNRRGAIQGKLDLGDYQEFWQLHDTGSFMDARLLHYVMDGDRRVISFEAVIWLVALGIQFAQGLFHELETGEIEYEFKLEGVKDQSLGTLDQRGLRLNGNYQTADEVIVVKGACTLLELRSEWREVLYSVVKRIFILFNLEIGQAAIDQRLDELEGKR
jgi:hypothetical protein